MGAYSIEAIIKALRKIKNDIPKFEKQVAEQVAPIVANEFKNIFDECIKAYYTSYSPKYYSRTWSMANAYKIKASGEFILLHSDASLIDDTHRVSPEYIFDHMFFAEGYHGGANGGPGHPSPGSFLYRWPTPNSGISAYTKWGSPAIKTQPVIEMVDPRVDAYLEGSDYKEMCANLFRDLILQNI